MINFYTKDSTFNLKSKNILKNWIKETIISNSKKCGDINVIFCSDPSLLEINKQFLGHDYYTDIITFNYSEEDKLSGELYISVDTVVANAQEYNQPFLTELHRVIIHGVLHLIGFDDHCDEDILQMRKAEDEALRNLDGLLK